MEEDVRERIQKLLVTGDNRLKQGVAPGKARESWEQALALAREAGVKPSPPMPASRPECMRMREIMPTTMSTWMTARTATMRLRVAAGG